MRPPQLITLVLALAISINLAVAVVNVDPKTGLLPVRGDQYASTSSGLSFLVRARCPNGAFISSWSIGLSPRNFSLARGTVQVQMVTALAGACSNASGPPYRFSNRLWGYGEATAGVRNVSVASPAEGQTVTGVSLEKTSTVVGGILSFMGEGTAANFSAAVRWQDSCAQDSYVDGYTLGLWLPPGRNDSAPITYLAFSCSGIRVIDSGDPLVAPPAHFPSFAPFLPLTGNGSVSPPLTGTGNETWLPWQGASTYLLSRLATSDVVINEHNYFYVNTRVCPPGSHLSQAQVATSVARLVAFNASCANPLTGAPVVQFALWGDETVRGAVVSIDAKSAAATFADVGTSNTTAGPVAASVFGVGAAARGVTTIRTRCPPGQLLNGYQLVMDGKEGGILSIRFHCSVVAGVDGPDPSPGGIDDSSPFPATLESSNLTTTEVGAQILELINVRRRRLGVADMKMRAPELCAARKFSARFGNTSAPNCSATLDISNTSAYLDSIYNECLGPGGSADVDGFLTISCQNLMYLTPGSMMLHWSVDNTYFLVYDDLRNASFTSAGIARVGYLTTGWFTAPANATQFATQNSSSKG